MKKITIILKLTALLFISLTTNAVDWQDILEQLTNLQKNTKNLPMTHPKPQSTKGKTKGIDLESEHAQRLAHNASIKAVENANQSISAIHNIELHLHNIEQIDTVAQHLNNVISGRGNSLREAELAKEKLQEVLHEAKQLSINAQKAVLYLEKTLRVTNKLNKRLQSTNGLLQPYSQTISKILDTFKNNPIS